MLMSIERPQSLLVKLRLNPTWKMTIIYHLRIAMPKLKMISLNLTSTPSLVDRLIELNTNPPAVM